MFRIGVDLGGTNISVGMVDGDDRIIAGAHTPTAPERGERAVAADIIGCIENALLFGGLEISECSGIGVGSPGRCDDGAGIVRSAFNLGWTEVPLGRWLSEQYGMPVRLANDADCAALGESVAGAAAGAESALMITLGTGIGSGMVIDGKIYAGYLGLGGELGHTCIALGGRRCTCGMRGCWEAYASATALAAMAREAAEQHPDSALAALPELDGESVFRAADEGDAVADAVTGEYVRYLAAGITNAINLLYPEVIVVGGGIGRRGERLLEPVRALVRESYFARGCGEMPKIVQAALGNDAGIVGAAALCRAD